jgi:hypothetical protein
LKRKVYPGDSLKETYEKEEASIHRFFNRSKGQGIQMKIKGRSQSPLKKKARRGFRGYPVARVAFYGPDNT